MTALVVVLASVAIERVGPSLGGVIIGLPMTAGPGYVLLVMSTGDAFIAESALFSFKATLAVLAFLSAYIVVAPCFGTLATIAISMAAWLAAAVWVETTGLPLWLTLLINAGAYAAALPFLKGRANAYGSDWPSLTRSQPFGEAKPGRNRRDLPF